MLTEVKAYSSWQSAPTLPLSETGRAETDLIQIRNIEGLEPVKAAVNTSPYGSVDGASYLGSSVQSRNIVLTLHPNPNWDDWTYEGLRKLLYSYFMPKRPVRLVFQSDDMETVQIEGLVEDVQVNQFSKDPELLVSIICPDPYFVAVTPTVVTGQTVRPGGVITGIDYDGTVDAGINVKVTQVSGAVPTSIGVQIGSVDVEYFTVAATVSPTMYFEANSLPMNKYIRNIGIGSGLIMNLLNKVVQGSKWPILQPGMNAFSVITDAGVQDWTLSYFTRYGGL